ncbi:trypsin-like serine protease [Arthrobacter globiformis]|uniref:Peptidase n=1 Tax=Arthrobacter globiformis TaxID=1665 RepID=A0A328HKR0_ARTGO|nr:trypsin-like serine protease [Arthrobacter globiformis]RAM38764.1 peptidase [Arthrobacter globiformis]
MTSSTSGPLLRRVLALAAAAAVALGAPGTSVPAYAAPETTTTAERTTAQNGPAAPAAAPSPAAPAAGTATAELSEEGLAGAVLRDLGMTLAEFNAAGEQGKRAAAALPRLRKVAGFGSIRLDGGRIRVEGAGSDLANAVRTLNDADAASRQEFVLAPSEAPATATPSPKSSALPAPPESSPAEPATEPATAGANLRATGIDQLYQAYLREVGPAGLQAVAEADGKFVIRTGGVNQPESEPQAGHAAGTDGPAAPPSGSPGGSRLSPSEFVEQYANVVLESGEPLVREEDFFGGQGYRIDGWVACSAGFSAFDAEGRPLVLTAGHCADDGAARLAEVTLPAGDPAGGSVADPAVTGRLGTFGFSQFGGPGNSRVTDPQDPGAPGNDIAVIESIRADLDARPAAATWANAANLGTGSVPIVGTASPFQGQPVCRSGRTIGWSCGTVDEVGIYIVGGGSGDPADLRSFRGFLSRSVESSGGDSGGPWISGNYAVGTHSAGNSSFSTENFAVAATLEESMAVLAGVQLRLFLNRPVLAGVLPPGPIETGQRVAGRLASVPAADVPAGTQVRVTFPRSKPFEVDVDAQGNWAFSAPAPAGEFTAQTVNGFSRSQPSTFSTAPEPAAPGSPAPGPPAPGGAGAGPATPSPTQTPVPSQPAASQGPEPAVLAPAPQPTVVAVLPAAVPAPDSRPMMLADTGVSGLTLAAAVAGAALLLGGLVLVVVRRRGRR